MCTPCLQYIRTHVHDRTVAIHDLNVYTSMCTPFVLFTGKATKLTYYMRGSIHTYALSKLICSGRILNNTSLTTISGSCPHFSSHLRKKRFLTVVFHFIVVKINMKESYIILSFNEINVWSHIPCEFVTRSSSLILCIHEVTEAHQCKQRNWNSVIINTLLNEFFLIPNHSGGTVR